MEHTFFLKLQCLTLIFRPGSLSLALSLSLSLALSPILSLSISISFSLSLCLSLCLSLSLILSLSLPLSLSLSLSLSLLFPRSLSLPFFSVSTASALYSPCMESHYKDARILADKMGVPVIALNSPYSYLYDIGKIRTDRQKHRQTDTHTETDRQTGTQTDSRTHTQTHR